MIVRVLVILIIAVPLFAGDSAEWLLANSGPELPETAGKYMQKEFNSMASTHSVSTNKALPLLMSAIFPGSGEVYTGHRRGWAMMALDVASWMKMKSYNNEGDEIKAQYFAYADEHWSEYRMEASFNTSDDSDPIVEIDGEWYDFRDEDNYGNVFYAVTDYHDLSLWVSMEDDHREYYENLGKWDQFVFGWDDFRGSYDYLVSQGIYSYSDDTSVLRDGRVSPHREFYRSLRKKSNDAYANADKMIWINMLSRIFSVFQTAYLNGMIFNGDSQGIAFRGHNINLVAEQQDLYSSRFGISFSY